MKIIGFLNIKGRTEMALSADSAMLNQHKPYFLPDWSEDIRYTPSLVVRICRLGKNIAPKFANRYYDSLATGADFIAWDRLEEAIAGGHSWTEAIAADGSLGIGDWQEVGSEGATLPEDLVIGIDEAIAQASRVMTMRQGDLIYIHTKQEPIRAIADEMTPSGNKIR